MKLYRIVADGIFCLHCAVVVVITFGWLFENLWILYVATLVITLTSELSLGYCFLSKWEFDLRKRIHSDIDYDYSFSSYYTNKLTHHKFKLSSEFIEKSGQFFLVASLLITFYFHFLN